MKLKITKERVLAAAAKCETAKETLMELFPEAFEDDKYYNLWDDKYKKHVDNGDIFGGVAQGPRIWIRDGGKSFQLTCHCNWELIKEDDGFYLLTPTKI